VVNINLFNIKVCKLETIQFLIYSQADSQISRPITKGARVKGKEIQSQNNRKDRAKNRKQRKNIKISVN